MKRIVIYLIGLVFLSVTACSRFDDNPDSRVEIPDFDFPETVVFEQNLSAYNIFEGTPANLLPSADFHLLELTSILFTDYAHKQRLVKVPEGTQMKRLNDGSMDFPDGTVFSKTFFYYNDERDTSLGKRIIETRLLIKESDTWNVATYLWNEAQTDASLELNGFDTEVSWITADGSSLSTLYHVPDENECITCHQSNSSMTPLGPTLMNLNRMVERHGTSLNQINHLQSVGVLNNFQLNQVPQIVDYKNLNVSLAERGRAYLAMNCAHCHHPTAWEASGERDFDFRYGIPLNQTGILFERDRIVEAVTAGEMPFIGTTLVDHEGVDLIVEFIESL
jgi:uncharacterized repeat protein (TIGR03806 family)